MATVAVDFDTKRRILQRDLAQAEAERGRAALNEIAGTGTRKSVTEASGRIAVLREALAGVDQAEELHRAEEAKRLEAERLERRAAAAKEVEKRFEARAFAARTLTEALALVATAWARIQEEQEAIAAQYAQWMDEDNPRPFEAVQSFRTSFGTEAQEDIIVGALERAGIRTGKPHMARVFDGKSIAAMIQIRDSRTRALMLQVIPELSDG